MPLYPKLESEFENTSTSTSVTSQINLNPKAPKSENNTIMATISLEIAEKMIFKFDGNKNKLYEFLDNCSKAIKLIKPEYKDVLLTIIETKLTDNARALIRNRDFDNWETLKNHLLDAYSEKRTMGQWQLELNSCKQNANESVISFSNKVENCYVKLLNSLDDNLDKKAREACINLLKNEVLCFSNRIK